MVIYDINDNVSVNFNINNVINEKYFYSLFWV